MKTMLAAIATCAICATSPAQSAQIIYILSGNFDVSVGGDEYDNVGVKLAGISDTGAAYFPVGPDIPVLTLSSLTAVVSGFGTVPLENMSSFFSNNETGIAGFSDILTGDFIAFSGLAPYDARSNLPPTQAMFTSGGTVGSPLGDAIILSASNLTFSAVVSSIPELTTWEILIAGMFGMGAMLRYRRREGLNPEVA